MPDKCACGRALIAWAGDMEETCAECRSLPDSCDCPPLTTPDQAAAAPKGRHRLAPPPAAATDESQAEELPAPSNPMAVARLVIQDHQAQGQLTLRHWRGSWMQWRRAHWAEAEKAALREALYTRLEHAAYTDTSGRQPVLRGWEPNQRKIGDLLDALAACAYLPGDTDPPAWLGDDEPFPAGEIVSCDNGLLHVGTRKLLGHTPRFFGTVSVPFAYDADVPAPEKWLEFLSEIWPDDQAAIDALQEWFGYVLSGRTDLEKILLLIGPTRSGKGTIARVLTTLVGKANVAGPTLASLGANFGLMPLLGKSLALVSDARLSGNETEVVERLLAVSGEDSLTVDRKYQEPWTGKLPARFMLLSNELPRFGDASGAIAGRFVILVMNKSFLGKEDPELTGKLLVELPGILSWSLDGLDRLVRNRKLTSPKSSDDAVGALRDLVSPVSAFVRDWCETGTGEIPITSLFEAWKGWAEANNHRPGNSATFGRNLRAVVPMVRVSQARDAGSRERHYVGIRIVTNDHGETRVPPRASGQENGPARVPGRGGTGTEDAVGLEYDQVGDLARGGTRADPKVALTHASRGSPPYRENNGAERVPSRATACQVAGSDPALCADPSCQTPLDPALVSAGVASHPSCQDPQETP